MIHRAGYTMVLPGPGTPTVSGQPGYATHRVRTACVHRLTPGYPGNHQSARASPSGYSPAVLSPYGTLVVVALPRRPPATPGPPPGHLWDTSWEAWTPPGTTLGSLESRPGTTP